MRMKNLHNSNSNNSQAFLLLHEKVQNWIYREKWDDLRDIQEKSVTPILSQTTDILIGSPTSSGKTEAAFLPIFSKITDCNDVSIKALCISPLKALINDQYERLSTIGEATGVKITRWHGDVNRNHKQSLINSPKGILLITPESLEAIFVIHGTKLADIFGKLEYIIIDELHFFIGTERGKQVQSLICRLEFLLNKTIPRIGLSATLGDMALAVKFLRNNCDFPCQIITSEIIKQDVQLLIKGYEIKKIDVANVSENESNFDIIDICKNLFKTLRGSNNLIFTNSRRITEKIADMLTKLSEYNNIPNEFFPHHGSLAKQIREEVEFNLKNNNLPQNVICTSTLELGIDIGSVKSVAQIDCPHSVASMKQRLGRSGRRGEPAILRMYITEHEISNNSEIISKLRINIVQSIALVNLLIKKWIEPPIIHNLHLSTFVQQIMSVIAQYGGCQATKLWQILCVKGAFKSDDITMDVFKKLLKSLGEKDIIKQMDNGELIHGLAGEKIVNNYNFYIVFNTPEEYKLVSENKTLGTIPIRIPLKEDDYLIFSGKRWIISKIDNEKRIIYLKPSYGGKAPDFTGDKSGLVHDEIRKEMFRVYNSFDTPIFLDPKAKKLLDEGRAYFNNYNLKNNFVIQDGLASLIFLWTGDIKLNTLYLILSKQGLKASIEDGAILVESIDKDLLKKILIEIINDKTITPQSLVEYVKNKNNEKYDELLSEELLILDYSIKNIDIEGLREELKIKFLICE